MEERIEMMDLLASIRRSLAAKILVALSLGVAVVMAVLITISINNQRKQIRDRMTAFGGELKTLAYAGIKHPMSVGDSVSVEQQLLDIRDELEGTEIVICDFNQRIVFATHEDRIGLPVSGFVGNEKALDALNYLFNSNDAAYESFFEEESSEARYLVTIHSIANTPECHHCHGSSRKVLGGLLTKQRTDTTYAAIASLRNRTIIASIIGIGALVAIIYFLLVRLVARPVSELAGHAEKIARGELDVSVPVRTEDSIGLLGASFNAMARSIKERIEFANSLRDTIVDPLFIVDTNMIITYMNEACAQLTGFSKEESEGRLSCREVLQSDICETNCPVRHCFEMTIPVEGIRASVTTREGRQIPIVASASPLKDAHGDIVGAVEICKDISHVLEAERLNYVHKIARREEEQRKYLEGRAEELLATLAKVSEGDLKVRAAHGDTEEVMDKIAQHTNHMLTNLEKLYDRISSFSKELELEVAKRTMMLRERTLLLERANRELRELDRLKSSFLANMSHELRTPMNSIIGYTDLIIDGVDGEINEEQGKSLSKISNNAKHLLQLINDILDMSKIESGKVDLDLKKIDIRKLIKAASAVFEPAIQKKNLNISHDFDDTVCMAYVDEEKVKQILNNLLSNAVKFTNEGGIRVSTKPSLQGVSQGEAPRFVEVCVEDSGIGIKEKDIGKLFDKFSQLDVSTIRQYEGTGLGLSIARGLVVLHKGVIWAESEPRKGTQLCFTLPVDQDILAKSAEPVLEPIMAETLARYFNKPVATFLAEPTYGGKEIKCWEYTHCGQTSCPGYGADEHRCWLIAGTHCKGTEVAKCPEKAEFCKGCEIIEKLVLAGNNEPYIEPGWEITRDDDAGDGKKTILAIDDNPEVIELIGKSIGDEYHVVGLLSGKGAVEKAKEIRPAAITLDIMMPQEDGWQVLRSLKNDPDTENIPVVVLSIVDEKKTGFSLGAVEYIVKPVDKKMLLQKLANLSRISRIKKVLVVNSEAETGETISRMLEDAGCEVRKALDSEEAVHGLRKSKPDLIVFDLIIQDINGGGNLLELIKQEEAMKDIPLILISHKNLSEEEVTELNGCIKAILNKSVLSEEDLLAELKKTIERMN